MSDHAAGASQPFRPLDIDVDIADPARRHRGRARPGRPPNAWGGQGAGPNTLPPLSRGLWPLVAVTGLIFTATQQRYPLAGDEYFFLVAGRHLDWGYADQPPLVALLARLADTAAPGSFALLRLPMLVAVLVGAVGSALIARELSGRRLAQLVSAAAFVLSPYALAHMRSLTTDAIDMACWTIVIWLLLRVQRTGRSRLWWLIGLATAVALQDKYLIGVFWILVIVAVAAVGPRALLRMRQVWLVGALAALTAVPSLFWQARSGWPQLHEGPAVVEDVSAFGGRLVFVPSVLGSLGPVAFGFFALGIWALCRSRRHLFLGTVIVALLVLVWVAQLRRNYLGGVYPLGIAAGAAYAEHWLEARRWRQVVVAGALAACAVVVAPAAIPLSGTWLGGVDRYLIPDHSQDWNGLAATVRTIAGDQHTRGDRIIVVAGDYWRSSALEWLAPRYSLPPVYGDMQGSWYFGPPPASTRTVIYVNTLPAVLRRACRRAELVRWFTDERDSPLTNERSRTPIYVCTGLRTPMPALWPALQHTTLPQVTAQ